MRLIDLKTFGFPLDFLHLHHRCIRDASPVSSTFHLIQKWPFKHRCSYRNPGAYPTPILCKGSTVLWKHYSLGGFTQRSQAYLKGKTFTKVLSIGTFSDYTHLVTPYQSPHRRGLEPMNWRLSGNHNLRSPPSKVGWSWSANSEASQTDCG